MQNGMRAFATLLLAMMAAASLAWAPSQEATQAQLKVTQVDTSKFPQVTVYVSAVNALGEPVPVSRRISRSAKTGRRSRPRRCAGWARATR
jgi:hypothetical protein